MINRRSRTYNPCDMVTIIAAMINLKGSSYPKTFYFTYFFPIDIWKRKKVKQNILQLHFLHHQFLESTQTHVHWVGDAIQPSHPLSSPSPPALNPSQHQGLFKWVSSLHRVARASFSFSISPSSEHPRLISFRMDWLDLLAVQGTLKSLLQHHSSESSILQGWAFFIVQLSHPYMTTGKTIASTNGPLLAK